MNRKFLLVTVLLVCAAGVAVFVDTKKKAAYENWGGRPIVDSAVTARATGLSITKDGATVTLEKSADGAWILKEESFPASAEEIVRYLDRLASARTVHLAGQDHTSWQDLGLMNAVRVVVTDGRGAHEFQLGKDRAGGGQYVRPADMGERVFLVDQNLTPKTAPSDWLLKRVVFVAPDRIRKIVAVTAPTAPALTFSRASEKEGMALEGLDAAKGEKAKALVLTDLPASVGALEMSAKVPVTDASAAALREAAEKGASLSLETFAGGTITMRAAPVTQGDKTRYFATVSGTGDLSAISPTVRATWDAFVFEIPDWRFKQMTRQRQDFLEASTNH